jgi:hypothetical protein
VYKDAVPVQRCVVSFHFLSTQLLFSSSLSLLSLFYNRG